MFFSSVQKSWDGELLLLLPSPACASCGMACQTILMLLSTELSEWHPTPFCFRWSDPANLWNCEVRKLLKRGMTAYVRCALLQCDVNSEDCCDNIKRFFLSPKCPDRPGFFLVKMINGVHLKLTVRKGGAILLHHPYPSTPPCRIQRHLYLQLCRNSVLWKAYRKNGKDIFHSGWGELAKICSFHSDIPIQRNLSEKELDVKENCL